MSDVISQEEVQKIINVLQEKSKREVIQEDKKIDLLKKCLDDYSKSSNFQVGDIVFWKENLKNRKLPAYNEPSIVIEVLSEPIYDSTSDSGSSNFKEPLTLKLGTLIKDDNEMRFVIFYYDGNRFIKK
ncbi:MAG: hypothetical protein ACTTJ6_06725 [Treponema sp.]